MGKYEEALERARAGKPIDEVFPELKESYDERIRKVLIKQFSAIYMETWAGIPKIDIIAYLEKQKEQKPADQGVKGRRGRIGGTPEHIRKKAENFLSKMEPPYDADDICSAYETGAMESIKLEWGEEDENRFRNLIYLVEHSNEGKGTKEGFVKFINRLKSLRPWPKEEREPMEIKYGGKIYQVHGMRALPGGASGYIIEDEPGHYDCIMNPEEVLGGGYGVKQNGSPYPTKEATFDEPHWKPSKEQIEALMWQIKNTSEGSWQRRESENLYHDLQKLL